MTHEHEANAKPLNMKGCDRSRTIASWRIPAPSTLGLRFLIWRSGRNMARIAGISLANHHMSLFAVAYLYNGLRQQQLIGFEWPLVERIMEL